MREGQERKILQIRRFRDSSRARNEAPASEARPSASSAPVTRPAAWRTTGLFAGEVAGNAAHAQRLDALDVGDDRRRALGRVAGQRFREKGAVFTSA